MTNEEALEDGFVYEGYCGLVPVFITDVNAFGHKNPGVAARWPWMEFVLDIQAAADKAACWVINKFKPGSAQGITVMFGDRLDGKPIMDGEID